MADQSARTAELRVLNAASDLDAAEWDACAGHENPFVGHAFFTALEDSGSAAARTGWQPAHIALAGAEGSQVDAILPGYLKSHSRGEYVFDHGWADAFERAGGRYYPKYQVSVPFTPATGPRLLLRSAAGAPLLLKGAEALCRRHGLSSAHATFIPPEQVPLFEAAGWLIRHGEQFHWFNRGYADFEAFLAGLSARKRKTIRRERRGASETGLSIRRFSGPDLTEAIWDAFWTFYQDTGARKWGSPYLTRRFFSLLGERMGERVILVMAMDGERPVAGALNLIGSDCLFGRYWGTIVDLPFLHFELCYYQAIDIAIERGLPRVEAGAQGPHKLARGYEPVTTCSAHWIENPALRSAVADYLAQERDMVGEDIEAMRLMTPYKKG